MFPRGSYFLRETTPGLSSMGVGSVFGQGNAAGRRPALLTARRPERNGDAKEAGASSVPSV